MKEERKGILNIEVAFVKTDPSLIKKLHARINLTDGHEYEKEEWMTEAEVKALMRYNVWTVEQFKDVSGLAISTISNLTRPFFTENNEVDVKLDICYPFSDSDGKGPKFIVRNAKSEKYIKV